eukprot:CAMPEP_0183534720 /NCGR_PEP_ID=MMETSP0371-20130417/27062_1 /TAXON_ID=268820 /ORGANISM="Peridinium aciculiferum, Strain PAER-2" /LENGTH=44 /DNA_ID= /DNA_START= /DNA_END= /DNA_ORIENTATION=
MAKGQSGTAVEPFLACERGDEWARESLSDVQASEKTDPRRCVSG